ncbi:MAG: hypothetical protein GAK45_00249 [Pseudomonas citronellolis]|nr:MAG: hypothetical protein GAK45_00249 [Pseudomonas citronellolis]
MKPWQWNLAGGLALLLATGAWTWQREASAASAALPAVQEQTMLRTELYFAAVPREQWDAFLAEAVTPRFPDGLSWLDVHGQWRGPSGAPEKLDSRLLILIHADNDYSRQALQRIGADFQQRFGSAVLKVSAAVRASDPDWTTQRLGNPQLAR